MDRLCVMIYEPSDSEKKIFRDVLVAHAVGQNAEVEIKWLKPTAEDHSICEACAEAQIAFVNAAEPQQAVRIGGLLHRRNPDCELVYYANSVPQSVLDTVRYFSRLVPSRPARYLYQPSCQDLEKTLQEFSAAISRQKVFVWENRGMKYRIPYGSIQYFHSDRNYVYLHLNNGTEYSLLGKLASLEKQLPKDLFVRVHQSYLVNLTEIAAVDKQNKTVHLRDGSKLYISKARYKETMEACSAE